MIYNLTKKKIEEMKEKGQFIWDGCACGDFIYQLDDHVWLNVSSHCRKSSLTPDEKLWHLHTVTFYDAITFTTNEQEGKTYITDIDGFGNILESVRLNDPSEKTLYRLLKKKMKETWGQEYREGELEEVDTEEQVERFVTELNDLLRKYNYELFHAGGIDVRETISTETYQAKASLSYNDQEQAVEIKNVWEEAPIRFRGR